MSEIVHSPRRIKARKGHICNNCSKLIYVGEEHEVTTYSESGSMYTWRTCDRCKQYVDEAVNNSNYSWDDGMTTQDFRNYMYEEHPEIAKEWWEL